ncbi:MAG: AsmA-like C-terminal region-containing protein [Lacunisphaera sp.]|nr:AsmA-like C-terminal region-containing protein [Lacunisphaera sp.]
MPTNPPPKHTATLLRFCGSCAVTLACWALWLVLAATLAGLVYISLAKELPVPGFVLRRVEANLAKANLVISFGRARFDPTGKILLENVQLRSRQFEDPLVSSRLVYLRRSFWSALAGSPLPDEIRLEGAVLQLPAMLSPSGTAEPLIRDLAVTLRHDHHLWQIDQLTARVGRLTVTARGELVLPPRPAGAAPLALEEITTRYLQLSRRIALGIHRLDPFDDPVLSVHLESPAGLGNTVRLLFTARSVSRPWDQPLQLGALAATTTLRLDGPGARPLRVHVAARSAAWQATATAHTVRAIVSALVVPEEFSLRPLEVQVAAGRVTADGEAALGPVLRADVTAWPAVRATAVSQLGGEFLAAEVDARLVERSARLRAEGRGAPEFINRVLARHLPRAAPYFVFGDPVAFQAEAVLDPGWKFARLSSRVNAGRIDSRGVQITAARGRIAIEGMSLLAHDARVELADNSATGSYWMDFKTTDYRMLLEGRLRPPAINGWFRGDWWLNFWNSRFAFPLAPPAGNVEVSGRWRDPARTVYFGSSTATDATIWGGDFERTQAVVFLRPGFTHGLELDATRAGGRERVSGGFKRFAEPGVSGPGRLEFDFAGNLAPATIGRMLDGKADAVLAGLRFTAPPQLHAWGTVGTTNAYTFTGRAESALDFYGFPLDTATVAGSIKGPDLRLDDLRFTVAGGEGAGHATLDGPETARELGFDVHVNRADLARAIRAVEIYQANNAGVPPGPVSESRFMKRASGGRLDVALSARGRPGDLPSFTGNGNAALTGIELGEINLFGLLSQVLSKLSLNFSSLKLDAARTSFRLESARLHLPDLKITGSSAVIDAHGDYRFATNALDFTAKFKPFEENRNPLTAVLGIVINPITSILELQLNGPLSNPNWSIVVGPSAAPRSDPPPSAPTTAPVTNGQPAKPEPPKA